MLLVENMIDWKGVLMTGTILFDRCKPVAGVE